MKFRFTKVHILSLLNNKRSTILFFIISVIDWFKRLKIISGFEEAGYKGFTASKVPANKEKILELLKIADL